jgi:hypothetical protein
MIDVETSGRGEIAAFTSLTGHRILAETTPRSRERMLAFGGIWPKVRHSRAADWCSVESATNSVARGPAVGPPSA